jgi:DDE family transposase
VSASLYARWQKTVMQICPGVRKTVCNSLAAISLGIIESGSSVMSQIALHLPGASAKRIVKPLSNERRIQRFVANPGIRVDAISEQFASLVLKQICARPSVHLQIALDETPKGAHLRMLVLCALVRKRALPLLWKCYPTDAPPRPMPELALDLLGRLAQLLAQLPDERRPGRVEVTLMTDRGLAWPVFVDFCVQHDWHFLLRVQGQTRVRLPDGSESRIDALVPTPGTEFHGHAEVFKNAGWKQVYVCARWPADQEQPWLLISSWSARPRLDRVYRRRMWQEESFRDQKSSGFQLQQSRIRDPEHANRLLLALILAQLWTTSLGHYVQTKGLRHHFERKKRKELSIFQRGLRFFRHARVHGLQIPTSLQLPSLRRPPFPIPTPA